MTDRAVRVTAFGGPEVLRVEDVPSPPHDPDRVIVRVAYAGLNPTDYKTFGSPARADGYGIAIPFGNGNDFSGVIESVGENVSRWMPGERVYGGRRFYAQADRVSVDPAELSRVPAGLPLDIAATLDIATRTAHASVTRVAPQAGEVVLVGGAAGGVGVIAAQLAVRAGATVVGTASAGNFDALRSLGVIPVAYGDGMLDRLRAAVDGAYVAAMDFASRDTIDAALALGVTPERINSVADKDYVRSVGGHGDGRETTPITAREPIAELVARGEIVIPIAARYALEDVAEAYLFLMRRHLFGKVVLEVNPPS